MALARYESVAVNLAGDVIPNATVEVREDRPGRPVVPLWADRNGTVPLGNPITTDFEGKFGFHVTGGSYYIRVFTGPSQQPLQQYVRRYQAIGTAAERDVEDLATALETGTATFSTLADLELFVPTVEGVGGKVTTGPDAGFYHYDDVDEKWVFDRPLYDSLARMSVIGGTSNLIEAEIASGVPESSVVMLFIEPDETNTDVVSINGKPVKAIDGADLLAGQWMAGRTYWFTDEGDHYKLRTESDVSGLVELAEVAAITALSASGTATDASASAGASAAEAAGYAAGLNLPPIESGDAGRVLGVNTDETGYEFRDVADQPTAEAGIDNTRFMTPLSTAWAIAALTTPFDPRYLDLTVSMLALQVADNSNIALFLGPTGNRVADSFDTLTYVDVVGATHLNTSTAGALRPTGTSTAISGATGTNLGNMTNLGGLAAAFDGVTSQGSGLCAVKLGTTIVNYVGKNYSTPKRISQVVAYPSNDAGFFDGGTAVIVDLYASQSAPSSGTDGTKLGTTGSIADTVSPVTITSSDQTTPWAYVWLALSINESSNAILAEAVFYEPLSSNLTVASTIFTAAVVPAAMKALIRVKEVNAAVAGTDYTMECSRDGGATWSIMTLTELYVTAGLLYVDCGETDVAGQPPGTSPRWRFKTLNNKNVELHDAYLEWS